MKQVIRIIGGRYRGKKLTFPDVEGLRPTPDRVRETLFNWLMQDMHGARCLDAFAGSGALGFEAYSRGAAAVVFIEQNHKAFLSLKAQVEAFQSSNLQLIQTDARAYFKTVNQPFDIIFLDPPFAKNYLEECFHLLSSSTALLPGGLLYVESDHEVTPDMTLWERVKLKKAGQVFYGLYRRL